MSYNPENQFRATIIRGRAKVDMDDLLPIYAEILNTICPCSKDEFPMLFNRDLERVLAISTKKTLDNHRTEIAGKLFGMYYEDKNNFIRISERTLKLIQDRDQPAFFKDLVYKFQFPSGMKKIQGVIEEMSNGLHIRQCAYLIEFLRVSESKKLTPTVDEIGYYVLNSLDVLRGKVDPIEVVKTIIERRTKGIDKKIFYPGKAASWCKQHIRETLNYLELANLIRVDNNIVKLNPGESSAIKFIANSWNQPIHFEMSKFDLTSSEDKSEMYLQWGEYFSKLSASSTEILKTPISAALTEAELESEERVPPPSGGIPSIVLGDEGETYVYRLERNRVETFNPKLKNKVLLLGKTKGLGFDIQSVRAISGPTEEYAIYIEVKSTKRVTVPAGSIIDSITLTRNEWIAAEQHRDAYKIFRVYFTPEQTKVFEIEDPVSKNKMGVIKVVPLTYQINFTEKAGTFLN